VGAGTAALCRASTAVRLAEPITSTDASPMCSAASEVVGATGNRHSVTFAVLRHEVFERFLFHGLPGPGNRKDKGPAACRIRFGLVLDHPYVGLGTIGSVPAHHHQLRPRRRDKLPHHLAKQGIFTAITRVALRQNEPTAHGEAIVVPRRHQQDEAQAKKPGMMLTRSEERRVGKERRYWRERCDASE